MTIRWDYAFEAGTVDATSVADELIVDQAIETLPPPIRKSFARVIRDIEDEARADGGLEGEIEDLEAQIKARDKEVRDLEQKLDNAHRALDTAAGEIEVLKTSQRKDAA